MQWNPDLSSSNWTNLRGPVTAAGATLSHATRECLNLQRGAISLISLPVERRGGVASGRDRPCDAPRPTHRYHKPYRLNPGQE